MCALVHCTNNISFFFLIYITLYIDYINEVVNVCQCLKWFIWYRKFQDYAHGNGLHKIFFFFSNEVYLLLCGDAMTDCPSTWNKNGQHGKYHLNEKMQLICLRSTRRTTQRFFRCVVQQLAMTSFSSWISVI